MPNILFESVTDMLRKGPGSTLHINAEAFTAISPKLKDLEAMGYVFQGSYIGTKGSYLLTLIDCPDYAQRSSHDRIKDLIKREIDMATKLREEVFGDMVEDLPENFYESKVCVLTDMLNKA